MLLERYDDYSSRAKMITEIHAQPAKNSAGSGGADADSGEAGAGKDDGPCSKKSALDKKAQDKKKEKLIKEKKRILKRL